MDNQLTPPANETIVIKAIVTNVEYLADIAHRLDAKDFTYRPYAVLYNAIKHLAGRGAGINGESVMAFLSANSRKNHDEMNAVGGAQWIDAMYDDTYETVHSLDEPIGVMLSASFNRRLYDTALQIYNLSQQHDKPPDTKLSEAQQYIHSLMLTSSKDKDVPKLGNGIFDTVRGLMSQDERVKGISIEKYMPKLDKFLRRLQPGKLVLLNALSKSGKTTICLDLAWLLAGRMGIPMAYADGEMTDVEMQIRLISKLTGYPQQQLDDLHFCMQHEAVLLQAAQYIQDAPLYRFDSSGMTEYEVETTVKMLQLKHGIKACIWDYPKETDGSQARLDKALGNKVAVAKSNIANGCGLFVFAPMQRNANTGRIADTADGYRYADAVIKLDRLNADEQSTNMLATHKLTIEEARYLPADARLYIGIDFDRQTISEM